MLLLRHQDVEGLLDVTELIDALATVMVELSTGRASVPPRVAARVPDHDAVLAAMPGYSPALGALTVKVLSVFPRNPTQEAPTHQALVVLLDPENGTPRAIMDGNTITAARTAACSALSIRLLARPEASVLAVLGTGVQARAHALAAGAVRDLEDVRIAGRRPERAEALAAELQGRGVPARAVPTGEEAVRGASIVCATTAAEEPVVRREWLDAGAHVTSVGYTATGREVDDDTVADALVVVEHRHTAFTPYPVGSNDLTEPAARGLIAPDEVAEIGELVEGRRPGRTSPGQLTLYKSVGVAVQDAAAAGLVYAAARRRGVGHRITL
ncbi:MULTISPECIES: ornithine cyclodeaminase family protein [unclassified Geodermatophilus]|uniref:ornithine cyclodeaminase family protein n=1 Tax=unclassified Geodermatophilus TaxID=2637632 RepID=UPI003EED9A43